MGRVNLFVQESGTGGSVTEPLSATGLGLFPRAPLSQYIRTYVLWAASRFSGACDIIKVAALAHVLVEEDNLEP